jgi:hypothetical protein
MYKFIIFIIAALVNFDLAIAEQKTGGSIPKRHIVPGRFIVPNPDPDNMMIVEFANAIDGTDGSIEAIGKQANRHLARENSKLLSPQQLLKQMQKNKNQPTPNTQDQAPPVLGF